MDVKREASFFERLISPMLVQLRRLAHGTRGEQSVDDLKTEAWIAAQDVRNEIGEAVEPEDERLQSAVLSKLRKAFGKFVNRKMRFAVQIDHEKAGDDGDFLPNSIAASLVASDAYEPEIALERAEEHDERQRHLAERFAEAVAYLRSLDHFNGDRGTLAAHLTITVGVLNSRLAQAEMVAKYQPSMFDRIEAVPPNFVPLPGRGRLATRGSNPWMTICMLRRSCQMRLFSGIPAILVRR